MSVGDINHVNFQRHVKSDVYQQAVGIDRPGVQGLRITPNLYTTTDELDALVRAIKELSS